MSNVNNARKEHKTSARVKPKNFLAGRQGNFSVTFFGIEISLRENSVGYTTKPGKRVVYEFRMRHMLLAPILLSQPEQLGSLERAQSELGTIEKQECDPEQGRDAQSLARLTQFSRLELRKKSE